MIGQTVLVCPWSCGVGGLDSPWHGGAFADLVRRRHRRQHRRGAHGTGLGGDAVGETRRSHPAVVPSANRSSTLRPAGGSRPTPCRDGSGVARNSRAALDRWYARTNTDTAAGSGSRSRRPRACRPPARGTRATRSADRSGRVLPFVPHLHEHSDVTWPERAAGDQLTTASPGIASAGGAACAPAAA